MTFTETHSNYESYNSDKYYLAELPDGFIDTIIGFSLRYADNTEELKKVCLFLAKSIPTSPAQNWGFDYLKDDLSNFLYRIRNSIPKIFDYLGFLISEYRCHNEINELLNENEIGYSAYFDPMTGVV